MHGILTLLEHLLAQSQLTASSGAARGQVQMPGVLQLQTMLRSDIAQGQPI